MKVKNTSIPDVKILVPIRFEDSRGVFLENWNKSKMEEAGLYHDFVQENQSVSRKIGTVRGLHFQAPPYEQAKLIRCISGRFLDVVVDFRKGSSTFGQWISVELSAENCKQILIPPGFLHGFITRSPNTEISYKCTDHYSPKCEGAIRFDDPDIGINWGIEEEVTLSEKDEKAKSFKHTQSPFTWKEKL